MIAEDVLSQLLDEDLDEEAMLAQRLSSSPPLVPPPSDSFTPLRKARRAMPTQDALSLKPEDVLQSSPPTDASIRSV